MYRFWRFACNRIVSPESGTRKNARCVLLYDCIFIYLHICIRLFSPASRWKHYAKRPSADIARDISRDGKSQWENVIFDRFELMEVSPCATSSATVVRAYVGSLRNCELVHAQFRSAPCSPFPCDIVAIPECHNNNTNLSSLSLIAHRCIYTFAIEYEIRSAERNFEFSNSWNVSLTHESFPQLSAGETLNRTVISVICVQSFVR